MSASTVTFPDREGLKKLVVTSSGNYTLPSYVTEIQVLAVGGGAGGGHGAQFGGGGGMVVFAPATIVGGETLNITIGSGGTGAPNPNNLSNVSGSNGGNTVLSYAAGSITSLGGRNNGLINEYPTGRSSRGGEFTNSGTIQGFDGEDSIYAQGGEALQSVTGVFGTFTSGGGGASFGPGGRGGTSGFRTAGNGTFGGGGGGMNGSTSPVYTAGNGGDGLVIIYYFENN